MGVFLPGCSLGIRAAAYTGAGLAGANKSGATNERKTALYSAIEQLRRDIAQQEDRLGLSPSGMKRINEAEMKSRKKTSKLTSALDRLDKLGR